MQLTRFRFVGHAGILLALGFLVGCGGGGGNVKTFKVSGKLLEKGNPIKMDPSKLPPGDPGITLAFNLMEGATLKDSHNADVDVATGTFSVRGPTGKGIPAGKYRISVHVGASGSSDRLKEKFTAENSPIMREINADSTDMVIDVSKPQG